MKNIKEPTIFKFEIDQHLIPVSTQTLDLLYSKKGSADTAALYFFYIKISKLQEIAKVKPTKSYCMKFLHWGSPRFNKAYKKLKSLGF